MQHELVNESKNDISEKPFNILDKLSRSARKFFKLFLWKMIYLNFQKTLKNQNEGDVYENFIIEIKKAKLMELIVKGRKIFINVPDGKDIQVKDFIIIICNYFYLRFIELKLLFKFFIFTKIFLK